MLKKSILKKLLCHSINFTSFHYVQYMIYPLLVDIFLIEYCGQEIESDEGDPVSQDKVDVSALPMDVEDGCTRNEPVPDSPRGKKRPVSTEVDDGANVLPFKRLRKVPTRFHGSSSKKGIQDHVDSPSDVVNAAMNKKFLSKLKS